ncbi:MAG: efflux RND transporter periplasmic adaptor subunit [Pirellulales bacterium]
MKSWLRWLLIVVFLGGGGTAAYIYGNRALKERNRVKWRTQPVTRGDITLTVNATGKVEPTQKVTVGAFVGGPVAELSVDFNSKVTKSQVLAKIDPRIYEASVQRDSAILKTREAEVERANALLQQAINDEKRSLELNATNPTFVSQTELDQLRFNRMAREADVVVTRANVEQAKAQLDNSRANLAYTEIKSPVDGIIVNRKIDTGQTLTAGFQTPELFVVAPEMEQKMHIYASVDEADIGYIRKAQIDQRPVHFTVDAYSDELFENGKIVQVRLSSSEQQNVITYPVIVETPNPEIKLLPGMTANLSFQIESREKVIKVPNAALRFYPERKRVHPDDYPILDGTKDMEEQASNLTNRSQTAEEKTDANRKRSRRHVWVDDGKFLRARAVVLGISDNRYTELLEGDLKEDEELVIGEKPKQ